MKDLIIPVNNNNEWADMDISYFLIERTPESIKRWEGLCEVIKEAAAKVESHTMYHGSFWTGFDSLTISFDEVLTNPGKSEFRDVTDEEREIHINMDDRLEASTIKVDADGIIKWVAWGKHCGTEFWTDGISLEDLKRGSFELPEAKTA